MSECRVCRNAGSGDDNRGRLGEAYQNKGGVPEGFIMTRLVFALLVIFSGQVASGDIIVNGGFETPFTTTGELPTGFGYWDFDPATTVLSGPSIAPAEGSWMLQFLASADVNVAAQTLSATASNVWQLIDMSPYSQLVRAGVARVEASAKFNRVPGDAETDTLFVLDIRAYAGDPTTFPTQAQDWIATDLARVRESLFSDGNPATWETLTAELFLPVNTDFVAVQIAAGENVVNDAVSPEFDGHYADAVTFRVQAVPEPSTLATFLGLGGMGLIAAYRRRKRTA